MIGFGERVDDWLARVGWVPPHGIPRRVQVIQHGTMLQGSRPRTVWPNACEQRPAQGAARVVLRRRARLRVTAALALLRVFASRRFSQAGTRRSRYTRTAASPPDSA